MSAKKKLTIFEEFEQERIAKMNDRSRYRSYELRAPDDLPAEKLLTAFSASGRFVTIGKEEDRIVITLL